MASVDGSFDDVEEWVFTTAAECEHHDWGYDSVSLLAAQVVRAELREDLAGAEVCVLAGCPAVAVERDEVVPGPEQGRDAVE